jgi:hypothetical protein
VGGENGRSSKGRLPAEIQPGNAGRQIKDAEVIKIEDLLIIIGFNPTALML